ncbi:MULTISPECIES: ABC transporter permease [Streptomyces]|uniref:ABC transporter permease n=1 Tax=Streptomyces TaxID=1883 RepID=UPI0015877CB5|nr:ABC transporter permease [Streptomyces sp. CAI-85]MBO7936705.1 ABC transporter permease [Streptomyces sp. S9]NUV61115.1 ABC transporter permease [Streptomyces sp. CAI-85]
MTLLWKVVGFEARRMTRNFAPVFFALGFPVLMLCMFGGIYGNEPSALLGGRGTVDMAVPAYLVMVVSVTGLMSFPLGLAEYRDRKVLKRFRATPLGPAALLVAQGLVNMALSLLGAALLVLTGYLFFGLHLPGSTGAAAAVVASLVLATLAMYAVGGVVAAVAPSERAATAVANLVYFPMIFLSGATIPLQIFPTVMKRVSDVLPATYAVELLQHAWLGSGTNVMLDVGVLAGLLALAGILAVRLFRWE